MGSGRASPSDNPGRRAARRYPLNADIEVLQPINAHGVVINASHGGLRVAVDMELPRDSVCVIEIHADTGKTVELARVAWIQRHPDGYVAGLSYVGEEEAPDH